jgi:hypothetical protein
LTLWFLTLRFVLAQLDKAENQLLKRSVAERKAYAEIAADRWADDGGGPLAVAA